MNVGSWAFAGQLEKIKKNEKMAFIERMRNFITCGNKKYVSIFSISPV